MKIDLTFSAQPGETMDLISILQKVAEIPSTKSAIEMHEAEAQLDMAYDEAKKKRLLKDAETVKERAIQESAPAPEPKPEPQKAQMHIDKPKAEPVKPSFKASFTEDQVRAAAKKYNADNGGAALVRILKNLGATCLSNLSAEKYSEFMEALNA